MFHKPPYRRQRRSGQDVFRTPLRLSLMKHPHDFTTFKLLFHRWKRNEKDRLKPSKRLCRRAFPVCRNYTVRAHPRPDCKLSGEKQTKFYDEHTGDIISCQAAKQYFNSLGLKKLPSIQSLGYIDTQKSGGFATTSHNLAGLCYLYSVS
jgi:hypothetical protein